MKTANKSTKVIAIVSGVVAGVLVIFLILIIFMNKELLKKGSTNADDEDRYQRMRANPNIDEESEIGGSIVRGAINKQSALTQTDGKASHKSLVI